MSKDWTGNANSVYKTLGVTNDPNKVREQNDYYATDPEAVRMLLELEEFDKNIWEVSCGEGHLSKEMEKMGYNVKSSDLIDRGYGEVGVDFLSSDIVEWNGDIITNPPYKHAQDFIEKSLEIIPNGNKVAMFLKVQFLESKKRKEMFLKHPPKYVYVSSSRILCAKNGDFEGMKRGGGSVVAYAWFIWEKGYNGETILRWFN